jgi:hypothetical protein
MHLNSKNSKASPNPKPKTAKRFLCLAATLAVGALAVWPACDDEKGSTCGNGKLGKGEECDCGQDPDNLPPYCTGINGAPDSNCSLECTSVVVETGSMCANGQDDDDDGSTDCEDASCANYYRCLDEICDNGYDDNGDGLTDCDDPDCSAQTICVPEVCDNGVDDNGDGHTDCQDQTCADDESCSGTEICWNSIDDNGDGNTDCDDTQCVNDPACEDEENPNHDNCYDELDNDGDGWVDCADPGCYNRHPCTGSVCAPDHEVNLTAQSRFSVVMVDLDDDPANGDLAEPCGAVGSREKVIKVNTAQEGRLTVHYTQQDVHKIGLYFPAGTDRDCADALYRCSFPQGDEMPSGIIDYGNRPAGVYYLIISEAVTGVGGQIEIIVTSSEPQGVELCGNKLDDDSDGAIDCGDLDCIDDDTCNGTNCVVDLDLGTIDATEHNKLSTGVLDLARQQPHPYPVDQALSCLTLGAQNVVISFTVTDATAPPNIQVHYLQNMSGAGDHAIGLFFPGGTGTDCDAAENNCHDTLGAAEGMVDFGPLPAGQYFLIIKARSGHAGNIQLDITATTGGEVCDDGFDNTGNGLVDCADPDCTSATMCVVEQCGDGIDNDYDGVTDCNDDDPDDICGCSYQCDGIASCDGGQSGQIDHDPEVFYLGECNVAAASSNPDHIFAEVTFDASNFYGPGQAARNDYNECDIINHFDDTPDTVLYFTVTDDDMFVILEYEIPDYTQGESEIHYIFETRAANQCQSCAGGEITHNCVSTELIDNGTISLLDLLQGDYAVIVAPDHEYAVNNPDYAYGSITVTAKCYELP